MPDDDITWDVRRPITPVATIVCCPSAAASKAPHRSTFWDKIRRCQGFDSLRLGESIQIGPSLANDRLFYLSQADREPLHDYFIRCSI